MTFQKRRKLEGLNKETSKDLVTRRSGAHIVAPVSNINKHTFLGFANFQFLASYSLVDLLFFSKQCPHDGRCPLETSGKYCHFVQRLQRTTSQRAYKVSP